VDTSKVADDPRATIEKMRTIHAGAMAPASSSSQDMRVAAEAMMALLQAQLELAKADSTAEPGKVGTDDAEF
ncbi:MAG TPA: putative metalloprotease CJM1_0395 family protein, partial [Burkholderiaceae bacterium]|nr:putative metalloprotease CJM1_0395 family protein [Burkholderiaceae bacterium]